jgi:ubiquinone/menaquinone biosynthesis C-methylase UbiE
VTVLDLRPTSKDDVSSRIIFVPTPEQLVERMLKMADLKKGDLVYDLGCGDGRIVVIAAKKYGVRGVGIDIDPERVREARAAVKHAGVEQLVEIRQGDALKVDDLEKATVVTLYMLPEFQDKLRPILLKTLKPGSRVVAHDYELGDWLPQQRLEVQGPIRNHILYLWRVGEEKK